MRHLNSLWFICGSLRIMPGAFSRASHSVTKNSAASCLVLSTKASASAICITGMTLRDMATHQFWGKCGYMIAPVRGDLLQWEETRR